MRERLTDPVFTAGIAFAVVPFVVLLVARYIAGSGQSTRFVMTNEWSAPSVTPPAGRVTPAARDAEVQPPRPASEAPPTRPTPPPADERSTDPEPLAPASVAVDRAAVWNAAHRVVRNVDLSQAGTPEGQAPRLIREGLRAESVVDVSRGGTPLAAVPHPAAPDGARQGAVIDLSRTSPLAGGLRAGERRGAIVDLSRGGTPQGAIPSRPAHTDAR